MLQGTGSDVGKSVLVAGLCRAYANRGLKVRPMKPQNMTPNSVLADDGGEIGGAQALQALACRIPSTSDMNPVLLKPTNDRSSALFVRGERRGTLGGNFRTARAELLQVALESCRRLSDGADLLLVEGAGSPAEINLRDGDIANMGFATAADVPVLLVGDIARGGVIAAIAGTRAVLDAPDAAQIRGFLVNKFRGDPALFADGYRAIERLSDWRGYGVVPWLADAALLPSEDTLLLDPPRPAAGAALHIACPLLPRIAHFDALDALRAEPAIRFTMVPPGQALPRADCLLLPDSTAPVAALRGLQQQGWDIDLRAHARQRRPIVGLGAGGQLLGRSLRDGDGEAHAGLGLLPVHATSEDRLRRVRGTALHARFAATLAAGIHCPEGAPPFARFDDGGLEGMVDDDGRVLATGLFDAFADTALLGALLAWIGAPSSGRPQREIVDRALDRIAATLEAHVDLDGLLALADGREK